MFRWTPLVFLVAPVLFAQEAPEFAYSIDRCPDTLVTEPGREFTHELDLVLTTSKNPSDQGAQGWSISVSSDGAEITAITTRGTIAASVEDDPPGIRDGGFEKSELGRLGGCGDRLGAVSAVVLGFVTPVTLPAEGVEVVARITVSGTAPELDGAIAPGSVFYIDGVAGSGCSVDNNVTWMAATNLPSLGRCDFDVMARLEPFRRGDPNESGAADISDAIMLLGCKFLGEACPRCRDASDINDDGAIEITDAIVLLSNLFLGGPPPAAPGKIDCGVDPTPDDSLPRCVYRADC